VNKDKLSRFHLKSILLGIGIGIVITAIAVMIYSAGRDPLDEVSEVQIIRQAEKYGMVKPSSSSSQSVE